MAKPCERSKEKNADYFCDHVEEEDNYFFKIMIGDFRERMTIPDAFVKHSRGKLSRTIKMESRNGCTFDAQITTNLDELVLQSGWNAFANAHDLQLGDFLLFKYNGISQLEILVFDPSGCEKVPSCPVINNTGQEPIDILSSSSRSPPEASGYFSTPDDDLEVHSDYVQPYILPRGILLTDVQKKKLGKRVHAINSKTPIYACIMNKSSLYSKPSTLHLSRKYADAYLPFDDGTLILERHGKIWEVRCSTSFESRRFTNGWKQFARDNSLKVGDLCLLELLKEKKKKQYIIRVHIIRQI